MCFKMTDTISYSVSAHTVKFGDKDYEITNRFPIFAKNEDEEKKKNNIKAELFNIFVKYMKS